MVMKICIMNGKPLDESEGPPNLNICDGKACHRRIPKSKCLMAEEASKLFHIETSELNSESKTVSIIKEKKKESQNFNETGTLGCGHERESAYYCAKDMVVQIGTCITLSQSGWYYEHCSSQEAKSLLKRESVGTFLIRDSSDSKYLYSLSVKTSRGTTSVRIIYNKGQFQLDSDERISAKMPKFDSAVRLVDFYARLTDMGKSYVCRWLERSGRKDLPIVLQKPKRNCVVDLKHLCRLSINRNLPKTLSRTKVLSNMDKLPLPTSMKGYLKEYPYIH